MRYRFADFEFDSRHLTRRGAIVGLTPKAGHLLEALIASAHARIDVDGPRVWIEDLGSKNGTFVNGERIRERVALKEGDQIVFGRTRAIVRMIDAASPTITLTGIRE